MIDVSDRYIVSNVYLIFINKDGSKVLRSGLPKDRYMRKEEADVLKKLKIIDLDDLYTKYSSSDLMSCSSTKLFQYMECEKIRVIKTESGYQIDRGQEKAQAMEMAVIRYRTMHKKVKYLFYAGAEGAIEIDTTKDFIPITTDREVGFYRKKLCLHNLIFTHCDAQLLLNFLEKDSTKRERISTVLLRYYTEVCVKVAKTTYSRDRNGEFSPFPREVTSTTLNLDVRNLMVFLYLDDAYEQFSFAEKGERPARTASLFGETMGDEELLQVALRFREMIKDKRYVGYFTRLCQLATIDTNKLSNDRVHFMGGSQYRYFLNAIKSWTTYAALYPQTVNEPEDISTMFTEKTSDTWKWLTITYTLVVKDLQQNAEQVVRDMGPYECAVWGKHFSRDYLVEFYDNLKLEFEGCVKSLRGFFGNIPSVDLVAGRLLDDVSYNVAEKPRLISSSFQALFKGHSLD
ncbi:uncharacterized protein KNAG_0I03090 [Huiozyma naganishii CBS 8797]|uniref:Sir1 ORC-binding domain-containing protein n=1 Tax=Huiozyma naganishii (strain ATCC MYA-139 / BCRC 22969 / CBS 8797 / KCTC 17520 / NBRC 10181 / NCYC 3082 / Yp74L-3) TaxID=1071383 RepID=J7RQM5_HUIN7|nr:hypothetical protein KNAG_0I03090 [Kazachstania naganishii CBS 8797]CCK72093.1 hypothetical protein KNAG_0I03090 [Kazachstania naganishii CBS 8797]